MKILICHMWMVIGGAETHVVELSRELAARGHDVTVASNGGVYVEALEKSGVKHVCVPLHTKKPAAVMESCKKLRELILREKFDIVHAHSRIPAFVCGILKKQLGFRFVTSTHGVFKVNALLAKISDWGEHSIAVSCDIKQYLMDKYGVPNDAITITINGIDTKKFHKSIDTSAVREELGLSKDVFRVLHVSRFDHSTIYSGNLLCEAAAELAKEIPNLEILIVGGGVAFEELQAKAADCNKKIGREVIRLTGPRTDIAELCGSSDAFAGVSRAALEAMSCERPAILFGAEGYGGIMRDEILEFARATNFCLRGSMLPETEDLVRDIREIYNMSPEERAACGALGRKVVLESYSVAKMADDHIEVYEKLRPREQYKHGEVIISGYYGFDNIGDDSLLSAMIEQLKKRCPDVRITVLTRNPKKLARSMAVRTINRFNLPKIASEMRHAKLFISGGGSLLQDGTSKRSLLYYVSIMKMAKKRGLKLMLYANGLGPLLTDASRKKALEIMQSADYISFREPASEAMARELGVTSELRVSADPAFLIRPAMKQWCDHIRKRNDMEDAYFIVSVKEQNRSGERSSADTVEAMAEDLKKISEKYSLKPVFVPMHRNRDLEISRNLCAACGLGTVAENLTAAELCGLMDKASFVIGTRLHTLIYAASMGVPMVGISYDPKIDAFLSYIGQETPMLDLRTLQKGQLSESVDSILEREAEIRASLRKQAPELCRLAQADADAAVKLLER